jgi:acetolactate synthase-1/2/3 large subunit
MVEQQNSGGDIIYRALRQAGVECVFGIISIHNMPIYDAIARQGGLRAVPARSEPGAVNMADGYSRATGKLGVAITSTGTGAGNAAGALVEAQTNFTPLLHLTGNIDSAYLDKGKMYIHECKDQLGMLKAIGKAAYRVHSLETLEATVRTAIAEALEFPQGVVSVEIPIDIQKAALSHPLELHIPPKGNKGSREETEYPAVEPLAKLLRGAKRPLIWAGGGVISSGAHAELTRLAELLGAAVLTSQAGRGSLSEEHPQCLGFFGLNPALRDFIKSCDMLLAVGTRLRGQETGNWKLPLPAIIAQVDVDPQALSRNYPIAGGVVSDARAALTALAVALSGRGAPDPAFLEEISQVRKAAREGLTRTLGPYARIAADLAAALPPGHILVRDITIAASTWASRLLPMNEPRRTLHASGGGIGQGLQMALGAKMAQPERSVVAICGDGGFMVNCGEMATAAQENLPVVVLLFNDGGYGVIRNIMDKTAGGRHIAVNLKTPDFGLLAKAFGWEPFRVERAEEFRGVFEKALACGQPALVEIDMTKVGPYTAPFAGPPAV